MKGNNMFTTYFDKILHLDLVVYCGFYLIIIESKNFAYIINISCIIYYCIIIYLSIYNIEINEIQYLKTADKKKKIFTAPQILKPRKFKFFGLKINCIFIKKRERIPLKYYCTVCNKLPTGFQFTALIITS
jgi:hypothetical protein